jgi:protein-tyrosine phosphatase
MREVLPHVVWIGNARDARDVPHVLNTGITAVVDLAMEEPPVPYPRDIAYCRFPLIDGGGNLPGVLGASIDTVVAFIRSRTPTLVACGGGMSRSPAVVAAALSKVEALPLADALERIASVGPHDVSTTLWDEVRRAVAS